MSHNNTQSSRACTFSYLEISVVLCNYVRILSTECAMNVCVCGSGELLQCGRVVRVALTF